MHQHNANRARRFVALLLLPLLALAPAMAAASNAPLIDSLLIGIVASNDLALFPLSMRERDPLNLLNLCYESLVTLDDDEHPQPGLASSWDAPSEGSKKWIFHLRPGVTFHNGNPLTAKDVCATLDRIAALGGYDEEGKSELPAEERGLYANLLEAYIGFGTWKAVDDLTVQITAARGYYGLLNAMTFPVLPADEVEQAMPAGTGPYKIEQYEPGNRIWLSAWPGWWSGAQPNVKNIMANIYPNTDRALDAFDSGEISATMTRSMSATRYSGSLRSFSLSYRTRQLEMLLMHHNEKKGILKDPLVRTAITAAIDRNELVKQIYQGMATPAITPIAPGTWLFDGTATGEEFNPAVARELLDRAGWQLNPDGKRVRTIEGTPTILKLNILLYEEPGGSVRSNAAGAIQSMLSVVGIETTVDSVTYGRVKERLTAGNFDLALVGMNLDVVPDPGFMFTAITTNYCRYRNETMIELIKKLRAQSSESGYRDTMSEVQHLFVSDAPFMCLYFRNGALITRDTFTRVSTLRENELLRGIESW